MSAEAAPKAASPLLRAAPAVILAASAVAVVRLLTPGWTPVSIPLGLLSAAGMLATWRGLKRGIQIPVALLLAAGAGFLLMRGAPALTWLAGLAQMSSIFAFVLVSRLLELPLISRGYDRATGAVLGWLAERIGGGALVGGGLCYLLTSGLSFGAIPITYQTLQALGDGHPDWSPEKLGGLVSRTFTAANTWSPVSPIAAFALLSTGILWQQAAPWALVISFLAVLVIPTGPLPKAVPTQAPLSAKQVRRFLEFLLFLGLMVAGLATLEALWPALGSVGAATGAVLVLVPVWEGITGGWPTLRERLTRQWRADMPHWGEQFTLFTGGGLLVAAASGWGAGSALAALLTQIPQGLLLVLVPTVIVALALCGLYPMVTMLVFGTVLAPLGGEGWHFLLCIALIVGATAGFSISPFSGQNLLMGVLTRRSSFEVALRWNLAFSLLLLALGTGLVVALDILLI